MKVTKENWKEIDVNIDSLWIIGPRAKGGKRENNYHGNFAPQVPDHLIRRYTEEDDVVVDLYMGSGTTLYECERLKRNVIAFDINPEILEYARNKMSDCSDIRCFINECDVTDSEKFSETIGGNLKELGTKRVDFILAHPPYWDIIKFTDKKEDISNISDLQEFLSAFAKSMENAVKYLRAGKHFAIVVGDLYREGEVVPLGFYMMEAIKKVIKCKLKGIVIKDIVGNRAKLGLEALWRFRTLKSDTFLFKHEYIFVFKKG